MASFTVHDSSGNTSLDNESIILTNSTSSNILVYIETHPVYKSFQVIILTIAVLMSLIGNSLSIIIIYKANQISTTTKIPMYSLAACYILINCVFGMPLIGTTITTDWPYGKAMCFALAFATNWFCACSVCTLFTLNLDRYIAVTKPLYYHSIVSKCKITLLVSIFWLFSFTLTCLNSLLPYQRAFYKYEYRFCLFDPYTDKIIDIVGIINLFLLLVFPMTATIVIYLKIYNISKFHAKEIATLEQNLRGAAEKQRKLDTKAAKAFLLVTAGFVLAWLPFLVAIGYKYVFTKEPHILPWWAAFCGTLSTSTNVVVYYWRNEAFRRPARRLLMRFNVVVPAEDSIVGVSCVIEYFFVCLFLFLFLFFFFRKKGSKV